MNELLSIQGLEVNLLTTRGIVHAVRGVDISIREGEIHGLIGESGCGKTITAKSILRLHDEDKIFYRGKIFFENEDLLRKKEREMQAIRGKDISMIFQDPMTALSPLKKVGQQIEDILLVHKMVSKEQARDKALSLLESVGIYPPERRYEQYPYEISGGMLQRVMIAIAIACNPKLLIADEPTTALDVTIQAQILQLILDLQKQSRMSMLMITHNFGIVAEVCNEVSVMYAGKIVESGGVREIFNHPRHPYTDRLMRSIPKDNRKGQPLETIPGTPPDLKEKIPGCPYAPRCEYAEDLCRREAPVPVMEEGNHYYACHKPLSR